VLQFRRAQDVPGVPTGLCWGSQRFAQLCQLCRTLSDPMPLHILNGLTHLHFHFFKNSEQNNNKLRPKSDPSASQIRREDGSSLQSRRRPRADATTPGWGRKPRIRSDLQIRWRWSRTGRKHHDGLHRGVQEESQSRPRGRRAS
jgi:hypothetical protein